MHVQASEHPRSLVLQAQSALLQFLHPNSSKPVGAGSLVMRIGCRMPFSSSQPWFSGGGKSWMGTGDFFQTNAWKLALFKCWRRLSAVGGSPSLRFCFLQNSQYLTSFTLQPALFADVYRLHTNCLQVVRISISISVDSPRFPKAS